MAPATHKTDYTNQRYSSHRGRLPCTPTPNKNHQCDKDIPGSLSNKIKPIPSKADGDAYKPAHKREVESIEGGLGE